MVRLLQFLAFVLMLRFVWRAVIRLAGGPETSRVGERSTGEGKTVYRGQMVRDPICGVYIPEQGALVEHRDGQAYYFCSAACRESFKQGKVVAG